jgi:hypothetical protein
VLKTTFPGLNVAAISSALLCLVAALSFRKLKLMKMIVWTIPFPAGGQLARQSKRVHPVAASRLQPSNSSKQLEASCGYASAMALSHGGSATVAELPTSRQHKRLVVALCVAAYVILAAAVFWPASPWNNSRLPSSPTSVTGVNGYGYGDAAQMTWFLAWVPYALRHGLSFFHTGFLDYPLGVDLANNTSVPILGLLAAPVTVLLGPIAAFNILLRLAFASSAASMFLVLRNWCRWPAAFVGGLVYGFGPYMVTQGQNHLNLVFVPLPPLILWCLYELLFDQKRGPVRMGILLGLLAGAQALISLEILALLALVVAVGLVVLAVGSRGDLEGRFCALLKAAGPAFLVFLVLSGWYLWCLLIAPGHLVGTQAPINTLQEYQADLLGPIVPTINEALTTHHFSIVSQEYGFANFTENTSYMGLPMLFLLGYFALRWRRDLLIAGSTFLALVALVLSFGPWLEFNGYEKSNVLPETVLAHLPVYDDVVPARFSLIVWLFAIIAVTVGADRLIRSLWERSASERFTTAGRIGATLILTSAVAFIVPRVPFITGAASFPSDTEAALNIIPSGSVVLTYPFTTEFNTEAMSWQAQDEMRFRIIGGSATVQAGYNGFPVSPKYPNYGVGNQPLLAQTFIQEYLTAGEYVYASPPADIDPHRALCRFIDTYHVNAVIFWNHGSRSHQIKRLFLSDFGTASRETHNKQLLVWLTTPESCQA